MIELSEEDLKFKKFAEYPGPENLVLAAVASEATEYVRTKYGQNPMYNQGRTIGMLMSILRWKSETKANQMTEIDWCNNRAKLPQFEQFKQRLTNMISADVFERIIISDESEEL